MEASISDPHRHCCGLFIYTRHKPRLLGVHGCECHQWGVLCDDCATLNTTTFYDLDVPLNPEDFSVLRDTMLGRHKWPETQFYGWVAFWVKALSLRFSHARQLIFFESEKFFYTPDHKFFYYLFRFVVDRGGQTHHYTDTTATDREDCVVVSTADATIRATLHIYGTPNGRVTNHTTVRRRTLTRLYFTTTPTARNDRLGIWKAHRATQMRREWRNVFRAVVQEIDTEVRFRPGMCGMQECKASFTTGATALTSGQKE